MVAELLPKIPSIPVYAMRAGNMQTVFEELSPMQKNWAQECNFSAKCGEILMLPDNEGALDCVLFGLGNQRERKRVRLIFGKLAMVLPSGNYHLVTDEEGRELAALAWLLSSYKFDKYKTNPQSFAKLVRPADIDYDKVNTIASSAHFAMDLINRPANDLTPEILDQEVQKLASDFGATLDSIVGNGLKARNFPLISAVGEASVHKPRLLELKWGEEKHPEIVLVGKGVCFDSGGLNIKPGSSMGMMKKDMAGAANALALARIIMQMRLKLRLKVLIPAVENSISSTSMRPGDIFTARNGLTVEVNNTDAEGRLILADCLAYAAEGNPDLIVSLATLTGAARVALGSDLVPVFVDDDALAKDLKSKSEAVQDPIWRMPFWDAYEEMIEPEIADLDNAPSGGMAGSITAALFLRRFVSDKNYVHMDIFGWSSKEMPGRPKGGAIQGIRALYAYLEEKYGTM